MGVIDPLLKGLNPPQAAAVAGPEAALLVLAGAGSGKTTVLTRRIAWLLQGGVLPGSIFATTFTNKAAGEIRERVAKALPENPDVRRMWLGTFHGLARRFLAAHPLQARLPENWRILDKDDERTLIRRLLRSLDIKESALSPSKVMSWIDARKEVGQRVDMVEPKDSREMMLLDIYGRYQSICNEAGLLDFAELLLRMAETLEGDAALKISTRRRFPHVLVDEFQDTNAVQYRLLKLLADPQVGSGRGIPVSSVFAVGDDDQCIYGWRGAVSEHLHRYQKDFSPVRLIRLEQNYRSTGHILTAANAVIAPNPDRIGKKLWSSMGHGEVVSVVATSDEYAEADVVISALKSAHTQGVTWKECAVLYRVNAQSRVIESACLAARIPYRISGGLRFFDRQEVRDGLAWLRLVADPNDLLAFERAATSVPRGLAEGTLSKIRERLATEGGSPFEAAIHLKLTAPSKRGLADMQRVLDGARQKAVGQAYLGEVMNDLLSHSGLREHYAKASEARTRLGNLDELWASTSRFDEMAAATSLEASVAKPYQDILDFLDQASLEADDRHEKDTHPDKVNLMTVHAAKGLEFTQVAVIGMEEGLFPVNFQGGDDPWAQDEAGHLAEERRLFYVAITRAKRSLLLTLAKQRRRYQTLVKNEPSRFLDDVPTEVKRNRKALGTQRPTTRNCCSFH